MTTRITSTISIQNSHGVWEPIEISHGLFTLDGKDPAEELATYFRERERLAGDYRLEWAERDGPGKVEVEGHWDGETLTIGPDEVAEHIYAAHIVTAAAHAPGAPGITVMTADDETSPSVFIADYPLVNDARDVLAIHDWHIVGDVTEVEAGYTIVEVEARDWESIVRDVTLARDTAKAELDRRDTAWRTAITDAMRDGGSATKLAAAAGGISRERIYQIRDGRR